MPQSASDNLLDQIEEMEEFATASEERMLRWRGTLDDLKIMIEMARRLKNTVSDSKSAKK